MTKKRLPIVILFTILLNLVLVSSVFASDISGSIYVIHSGYSTNFGIKSWGVYENYYGDQSEGVELGQTYQLVSDHDFLSHTPSIYSPEIGEGTNSLVYIKLQNSSGSTVGTLSSFSSGNIRSFILNPSDYYYPSRCSYAGLEAFPAGSYRIEWDTIFSNPNFSFSDSSTTSYTSYF